MGVMSINLSLDSVFKKVKDSSSNQSIIETDIEKKAFAPRTRYFLKNVFFVHQKRALTYI